MPDWVCRPATSEDAEAIADLYAASGIPGAPALSGQVEVMLQTGHAFLVADDDPYLDAAVRFRDDEGIGWFDLLVSAHAPAGVRLIRAVERVFQDRGLRLARAWTPETAGLPAYFARLGYLPIGQRTADGGEIELLLERRLPLLTVREQRRTDAAAIAALTGEDPWFFEQGARPGWFVASDGDRLVGVASVRDAGRGLARVVAPVLAPGYEGRNLELWMLERAALYGETNGYHTAEMPATPGFERLKRELEDRRWFRDGDAWRRVFFMPRDEIEDD